MTDSVQAAPEREALETMVAEADTGGRKPTGFAKTYIFVDLARPGRCSSSGTPRRCPTS